MFPGYCNALENYYRRLSNAEYDFFLNHDSIIGLSSAKKILSIGAGLGRSEELLKKTGLLTELTEYHALEPEKSVFEELRSKLTSLFPGVKLVLTNLPADDYTDSKTTFDVIFMTKVLNYVTDQTGLIKRALTWLNPGGKLVIEQRIGESSITKFGSRNGVSIRRYNAPDLEADLKQLGLPFKEFSLDYEFDVRHVTKEVANFYLLKEATVDEYAQVKAFIEENVPTGIENNKFLLCVIEKPN